MGKASSSCLNLIVCGSDSPVEDGSPEAKGFSDKRGWSFRTKPSKHRVLSNSVITENRTPVGNTAASEKIVSAEQLNKKLAPQQQTEKLKPDQRIEEPEPEPHIEKAQPPPQMKLNPQTSLELELFETVDTCRSSNTIIIPTADDTVVARPELPKYLETKTYETVAVPSPELPESVEAEVCETVVEPFSETSKTVEANVCETVVEPASELSESVKTKVTGTEFNLSRDALINPLTEPVTSTDPKECQTMSHASVEPNINEAVVASHVVDHKVVLDEPCAVVIQSGVRGSLAQMELSKLKSAVKLQAVIRGHLVRRHAVGTLRCFQGIVKAQIMIRGHCRANILGQEVCSSKPVSSQTSIEKLLNNTFARRLLESTTKSKSTSIKCDPMKPSLTWTWLERWMAASSSGLSELHNCSFSTEEAQQPTEGDSSHIEAENLSSVVSNTMDSEVALTKNNNMILGSENSFKDVSSLFLRSDSSFKDAPSSFLISEPSFKDAPSSFLISEPSFKDAPCSLLISEPSFKDAPALCSEGNSNGMPLLLNPVSGVEEALHMSKNEVNTPKAETAVNLKMSDPWSIEEKMETSYDCINESSAEPVKNGANQKDQGNQSDSTSQTEPSILLHNTAVWTKEPKLCMERSVSASEQIDADVKNLQYGSRKASKTAFIAAQSKFKELSSTADFGRSLCWPLPDNDGDHANAPKTKPSAVNIPISDDSKMHIGGSETELSVTSTLDSPDRSEVGEADIVLKFTGERTDDMVNKDQSLESEAGDKYIPYNATELSSAVLAQQRAETSKTSDESTKPAVPIDSVLQAYSYSVNGKCIESITTTDSSPEMVQKPEISSEKNQTETIVPCPEQSAHVESPPLKVLINSRTTTVGLQETLSLAANAKKGEVDKSGPQSHPKRKSVTASKLSPSHDRAQDSVARSSKAEHGAKDQKSDGKRRNSFGSTKIDKDLDQEPRDSISSIKMRPSYMQATQSARAKAHSPRSSPDVHENKDTYVKKRHSLPGASGRHGSPRVQRSPPRAQPTKSNGNTPPHERKWVR